MTERPTISRYAEADVPTEYGEFKVIVFREALGPIAASQPLEFGYREHLAIVSGDVRGQERVPVRVHSECLTGEVLHSLKCDCREQLDHAMRAIGQADCGAVLYLRQEGRGIGLGNKIRAYALQQQGHDTVDANILLGFGEDQREYRVASEMVRELGIRSLLLMTNNPDKVESLRADGVAVAGRLPVYVPPNEHNRDYLIKKRVRMGHLLGPLLDELHLDAE